MGYKNYNQVLLENFSRFASQPALMFKQGGVYTTRTYAQLGETCKCIAAALLELGLKIGDRIVILSANRPEWAYVDLGSLLAGAITSAVYTSNLAEEAAYIINDLEAKFVFVENQEQLDKLLAVRNQVPSVQKVYVFETYSAQSDNWISPFSELIELGKTVLNTHLPTIQNISQQIDSNDTMCIIYTSGTTGHPKGVMLTHRNYLFIIESLLETFGEAVQKLQRNLSFLPLAHSLERLGGHYLVFYIGRTVAYAESLETLLDNFKEVKPTFVTAVPRVFEKVHARIVMGLESASPVKRKLFYWALKVGQEMGTYKMNHKKPPRMLALRHALAERLIYKKVQSAFGGELKFFVSGGAPLSPEIAKFFHSLGVLIIEGYGLTETNAPSTINRYQDYRIGSVGKALPGVELKLAEDGEILVRGPHVFKGYWKRPQDTAEVFTEDGFFMTGDIGRIDEEGWVYITDRKKQLIITAGGKNIAPAPIEQLLLQGKHIDQVYIHGDRRKYLTALIVPNEEQTRNTAREMGIVEDSWPALLKNPQIIETIQREVDTANKQLARYMQIKYFRLLPEPFTVETGELTPTLKQKKRVIEEKYGQLLDEMYDETILSDGL